LDCRDITGKYYKAEISKVSDTDEIKIHYIGFSKIWDEWKVINVDAICHCQGEQCTTSDHQFADFHTLSKKRAYDDSNIDTEQKYQALEQKQKSMIPFAKGALEEISFNLLRPSINVIIIGEVSCGKSTLLNALFVRKFGNMAKAKSTMSVNIFKVTYDAFSEDQIKKLTTQINKKLGKYNQKYSKTAQNKIKQIQEFDLWVNDIPDLIKNQLPLNIIDMPGFNDGDSNDLLVKWFERQSHLLDIILFVIDVNSALNTKSENDLLDLVLKHAAVNKSHIIFIVNKFDEHDDDELKMMFADASKIIAAHSKKFENYSVVRMSAFRGHIYRHMMHRKTLQGLDQNNVSKLATLEFGKNARKWSMAKLEKNLRTSVSETDIPGFADFKIALNVLLKQEHAIYSQKLENIILYLSRNVATLIPSHGVAIISYMKKMMQQQQTFIPRSMIQGIQGICSYFFRGIQGDMGTFLSNISGLERFLCKYDYEALKIIFTKLLTSEVARCGIIKAVSSTRYPYQFHAIITTAIKTKFEAGITISTMAEFQKMLEIANQFKVFNELPPGHQIFETYTKQICDRGLLKDVDDMEQLVKNLQNSPADIKSNVSIMTKKMSCILIDISAIEQYAGFAKFDRDEHFIMIFKRNDANSWFLYLFLEDLILVKILTPWRHYKLFTAVKYINFPFKSNVNVGLQSKYNHRDFEKFPNILATFKK
jgi:small GTP-binding protein